MTTLHRLEVSMLFIVFLVTEQSCLILMPVEAKRSPMPREKDLLPANLLSPLPWGSWACLRCSRSGLRGSVGRIPALFDMHLGGSSIAHAAAPGPGGDRLHGEGIRAHSRVGIGQ